MNLPILHQKWSNNNLLIGIKVHYEHNAYIYASNRTEVEWWLAIVKKKYHMYKVFVLLT